VNPGRALSVARSSLLWALSLLHFGVVCTLVVALGGLFGQRRVDPLLRWMCRNVVWLAGARLRVRYAPGFDRTRTCFLVVNHTNLFDPFVVYSVLPQFARGLGLGSHFKVPVYGWLMGRFGNVPVPDRRTAQGLKRTYRLARQALDGGISLIVFPEGGRTLDGSIGPFEDGVFRMARQLRYPIVPVTVAGAYRWKRKTSRLLRPATVTVHFHDTLEIGQPDREELRRLSERVRAIVAAPVQVEGENQGAQ